MHPPCKHIKNTFTYSPQYELSFGPKFQSYFEGMFVPLKCLSYYKNTHSHTIYGTHIMMIWYWLKNGKKVIKLNFNPYPCVCTTSDLTAVIPEKGNQVTICEYVSLMFCVYCKLANCCSQNDKMINQKNKNNTKFPYTCFQYLTFLWRILNAALESNISFSFINEK